MGAVKLLDARDSIPKSRMKQAQLPRFRVFHLSVERNQVCSKAALGSESIGLELLLLAIRKEFRR